MPPLVGLVLLGAGVVAGIRAFQLAAEHLRRDAGPDAEAADASVVKAGGDPIKDLGALEFDPQSGVYRPKPH